MSDHQERTARAWIQFQRNSWAFDEVFGLCQAHPRKAWRLICRLAELAITEELIADLGAGPLEDFVREHAPTFIGQIERRALVDARLRRALRMMWLPMAHDPISERLFALGCSPIDRPLEGWQKRLREAGKKSASRRAAVSRPVRRRR